MDQAISLGTRARSIAVVLAVAPLLSVVSCAQVGPSERGVVTLYRSSSLDPKARVHFGSFDAVESDPSYNMTNCRMAARLLNANVRKLNDDRQPAGFWCEPSRYEEDGSVPTTFDAAFPTDT